MQGADRKRENESQVEEESKDQRRRQTLEAKTDTRGEDRHQRRRQTPEAKSSSRHDGTSVGHIANAR